MADQSIQDVVNQAQSVGDPSPSDVPAPTTDNTITEGDVEVVTNNNISEKQNQEELTHTEGQESRSYIIGGDMSEVGKTPKDLQPVKNGRVPKFPESTNRQQELKSSESDVRVLPSTIKETDVNGEYAVLDGTEEGAFQQAFADASGGSDTDASRPGTSADGLPIPSSSVKKPTSFKAVSVTKNFLAKAAGSPPIAKGASDKASFSSANSSGTSLQQTSRPRLVAKSTSGLRDSTPKSKSTGNRGGPGGPDPIQVWNKNRPVQALPPKHLTDEELKQQYGIHMTSRIQADGEGKEAKWADIDDDEDDWVPETIEWNDGTKVTLTQAENVPVVVQDVKPEPPILESHRDAEPVKPIVARPSSSVGPNATILKVGASREGQLGKSGSLALKGTMDKISTNSTKSQAPAPSKSPWAPLPPVDKVSPITINPPIPVPQRQYQREGQGYEQMPNTQQPAREMAADDFNRNWRDGQSGLPRELFNSQSGRYEPVGEGRRGSRNDQQFRPPSLLQRPTQNDQSGPAEPSAAFQTHRTSTQDGMWGRRRNSSNVSGGSGSFGRRMSLGKPSDLPSIPNDHDQQRRGSQQIGSTDRAGSPRTAGYPHPGQQKMPPPPRGASPGQIPTWQSQGSPASQYTQPSSPAGPNQYRPPGQGDVPAQPQPFQGEDPVAMQQRIMREKLQEARKRKIEQEEREEAEKRERIRLKLEAMGPPPADKKEKQVEAPIPSPQPSDVPTQSPPKPPVPEATGEPMQYGMMKVHHPDSVKKMTATNERLLEGSFDGNAQSRRISSPSKPDLNKVPPPQSNGIRPVGDQVQSSQAELQSRTLANEKTGQPWNNAQPPNLSGNASSPWAGARPSGHPSTGGSLWGPPTNDNDRALGNGTFDRTLTTFPPRDIPLRNHLQQPNQPQPPMGMPARPASPPAGPNSQQPFASLPVQPTENFQSVPTFPSPEKRSIVEDSEQDNSMQRVNHPGPIGPPSGRMTSNRWQPPPPSSRPVASAWNDFHSVASREEAEQNDKYQKELAARLEEEQRTGIRNLPPAPPIIETWREVEIGDEANSRNVVKATKSTYNVQQPIQQAQGFGPVGSIPGAERTIGTALNSGRGSRFFPHQVDNVQSQGRRAASYSPGYVLTPSPPPAEGRDHPVFDGDIHRPIVNLPHPKPVVKLPSAAVSPPASVTFSPPQPTTPSLRVASQPIASTVSWQDRFNGLLGKKTSPEKKHGVLAVTSATKEPLEDMALGAAVSLPKQDDEYQNMMKDAGKVTSKDVEEEEAIFEDREAGSLPIVRLSHIPIQPAWQRPQPDTPRPKSKYLKPIQPLSIEPFIVSPSHDNADSSRPVIIIHLPEMSTPITKALPRKAGTSTPPRPRNPSSTYNKQRKGGSNKSRESSGSYTASQNATKDHAPVVNGNIGKPRSSDFRRSGWAKVPSGRGH